MRDEERTTYEASSPSQTAQSVDGTVHVVDILGVLVHGVTNEQAMQLMRGMIEEGSPHHVVTVNPEFVMLARRNQEFKRVLRSATLALPDGVGILYAARLLGVRVKERVAGVDCVYGLASLAAMQGFSIFLLGAAPGVAEHVGDVLRARNPGLRIAGCYAGSPEPSEEDHICGLIASTAPDILLVAYGAPKQDLWIARTRERLRIYCRDGDPLQEPAISSYGRAALAGRVLPKYAAREPISDYLDSNRSQ